VNADVGAAVNQRDPEVISVAVTGNHLVRVKFDDGVEGQVDLSKHLSFKGVFEPLLDIEYFARVAIEDGGGSICWPNGADIDPLVLHDWISHSTRTGESTT